MDGTLIRNTDSVQYLCALNNNLEPHGKIQRREDNGSLSWIEADYLKVRLINGLDLTEVKKRFMRDVPLIRNIDKVLLYLREKRIKSVLVTSGPVQVADIIGKKFGFDCVYGSQYELNNNRFTGEISTHMDDTGKLSRLIEFCAKHGISPDSCVAIGDSESDISVFEKCWKSIAINYADVLKGKASEYIITDDLSDIIDIFESWLAE
jgi:phosphoserine phosphatase